MRLTRPSWSAYALIMGRCWTGYTSIAGGMLGMTHSYRTHGRLAAAWGHLFSSGYGLCEAKMPSEKIRWIRSLRGAECEKHAVVTQNIGNLGKLRDERLRKAWHTRGNPPHG